MSSGLSKLGLGGIMQSLKNIGISSAGRINKNAINLHYGKCSCVEVC